MDRFIAGVANVSRVCGIVSASLIAVSVLIVCQLVFVRYVLNESTIWQTEFVIYAMIAATLLGMPYVQLKRGHVNVDLIPLMMGPTARKALAVFSLLLGMAICGVIAFFAYELWHLAYKRGWRSETVWAVPLAIPYLATPLGFGLMILQYVADLIAVVTDREPPFGIVDGAARTGH